MANSKNKNNIYKQKSILGLFLFLSIGKITQNFSLTLAKKQLKLLTILAYFVIFSVTKICILVNTNMERYPRGPRGHPAKVLVRAIVARVQISLSPPNTCTKQNSVSYFYLWDCFGIVVNYERYRNKFKK